MNGIRKYISGSIIKNENLIVPDLEYVLSKITDGIQAHTKDAIVK